MTQEDGAGVVAMQSSLLSPSLLLPSPMSSGSDSAALLVQRSTRGFLARSLMTTQHGAALGIQTAFRSYSVCFKYKHLLQCAHHHGDAKTLSKAVLARAINVQVSFSSVCVPAVFTAMDLSCIPD